MASGTKQEFGDRLHIAMTNLRLPLMIVVGVLLISFLHDLKAFFIAVPVTIFGELIQIWAASHLHKNEYLAISGPYSYVRNPMYVGRFFLGLGFFIMTWNIYLIAFYIIFFAVYVTARVSREEKRLIEIFNDDYRHYCSEIRRFFPKMTPYSRSESRKTSWMQVCVNHEEYNLIGLIVVLAVVFLRIVQINTYWPKF